MNNKIDMNLIASRVFAAGGFIKSEPEILLWIEEREDEIRDMEDKIVILLAGIKIGREIAKEYDIVK